MMRCPLCGFEFEETAMNCHSSCTFNESCAIICCPNCGYQVPDERRSRVAAALRRAIARGRGEDVDLPPVRPLSRMQPGQCGRVVTIQSDNHSRVERLNILGLTADAHIILEQKRPTYVLRVGFTELSVEREIAENILVDVSA